jgi:hypothetical protein
MVRVELFCGGSLRAGDSARQARGLRLEAREGKESVQNILERIPHPEVWHAISERLSTVQIQEVFDEIEKRLKDKEVNVAGWIPGADWTGTPFEPIYSTAARSDYETAAKMFGLLVWVYFMRRPDCWSFGRYNTRSQHVESMTYFLLSNWE